MQIVTRLALAASLAGCAARPATTTTPAPNDTRILELEARISQLEAQPMQAEPRRRPKKPSPSPADASATATATELAELQRRIFVLESSTEELWTQVELQRFGDLRAVDPRFVRPPGTPRPQPEPAVTYSVPIKHNASLGDPAAKVTWVIGTELTEPFTRRLLETLAPLRQRFGADLRIVFKHHIVHDYGIASAMLLCAADQQGKYEQAQQALVAIPLTERSRFRIGPLTRTFHFLDVAKREKSLGGSCQKIVRDDHVFAQKLGQSGVPYSFINGRFLGGAQPPEAFARLIEEELAKANAALGGKSARGYYDSLVKTGKPQP